MTSRFLTLPLAAGALALAAAGCGGSAGQPASHSASSSPPAPAPAPAPATAPAGHAAAAGQVAVALSEWAIRPSVPSAKAGVVTFNVRNDGKAPHEMVVIRTSKPAGGLGSGARVPETGSAGETGDVAPGASKTVSLRLKAGKYVLICNIPGHYMSGMHTAFTVS